MQSFFRLSLAGLGLATLVGVASSQSPQPVQPKPAQPQPVRPQPIQIQPASPQPTTPQPGLQPGQPKPGTGQPGQPTPGTGQPGQPIPGTGQPGQPIPGTGQPGQPVPGTGQPVPGQPLPGQVPGQPQPGQPRTGTGQPGQPIPGTGQPGQPTQGSVVQVAPTGTYQPPAPLYMDPMVRKHLRIADDQVTRLTDANKQLQERYKARIAQLGDPHNAEGQVRAQALSTEMNAELQRAASSILAPDQMARYRQLELQRVGTVGAFYLPDVQQQLGFDQQQLSRFQKLQQDYGQQLMALYPDLAANRNNAFARLNALRENFDRQWMSVLTAQQRQTWTGMLGEPYDFQQQPQVIRFGKE